MNNEALFLFLILLLGLVLCSFLGGNCGKEGFDSTSSSQLQTGSIFTDVSGNTITVISNNGSQSLQIVQVNQTTPIILTSTPPASTTATANTFYAQPPLKMTATVVTSTTGQTINLNLAGGQTIVFTQSSSGSSGSSSSSTSSTSSSNNTSTFGGFFDNYNHYSGSSSSSQLQSGAVYTDGSGNNVTVILNANGTINLQINQVNNNTPIILTPQSGNPNVFIGTGFYSNMTATVITTSSGQMGINVTLGNGQTIIFTPVNSTPMTSTQYYGSTGTPVQSSSYNTAYTTTYNGAYGGSAGSATGPQGNTAYYAQGPQGNTVAGTTSSGSSSYDYYNSLPPGIPGSQIPPGQEDLYILKSQVVPPVCPVCPSITSSSNSNDPDKEAKCPPCAPCARCPEPSFECKKVPNYSAIDNQYLPQPVLSDFSTFGM
jgi:hypothetical protein